jgi:hypothetical protein
MNKLMLSAAVSLLAAQLVLAPAAMAGTQQDKMTACNKQAGEKKLSGDERKKFMSECLSAKKDEGTTAKAEDKAAKSDDKAAKSEDKAAKAEEKTGKTTQQEKMTSCNKQAGEKKLGGEERKKFMSDCLKG